MNKSKSRQINKFYKIPTAINLENQWKFKQRKNLYYISCILFVSAKKLPPDVNANGVFACNELDLKEVKVYGFDYDYTLACYKPSMDYLLYNLGRDMLIKKYKVINYYQLINEIFS